MSLGHLQGKRVYFDTNPFIYFIEQHDHFYQAVKPFFQMIQAETLIACTSDFTLTELLIKPHRQQEMEIIQAVHALLLDSNKFEMLECKQAVFLEAAKLGGTTTLRTPDAIHVACAVLNQCDFFITNDQRIRSVGEMKVLQISDYLNL